jgi:endonuclease-3
VPKPPSAKTEARQKRVAKILPILQQLYPDAKCSLDHASPLELLVATILSAQSTDERVNIVTKDLFRRYPSAKAFAKAPQEQLEADIRSTGFFRNKARSIRLMASALMDKYSGQIPRTMEELIELPGVGRKTANVVLGNAFNINVGITVDTHVTRLANRLGLTDHKSDAVKIEKDLIPLVPQKDWALWSHLLIYHGRAICTARNPRCEQCPLLQLCPAGQKFMAERKDEARKQHAAKMEAGKAKKSGRA